MGVEGVTGPCDVLMSEALVVLKEPEVVVGGDGVVVKIFEALS